LIAIYGPRAAGEVQRLRINSERRIFVVLDTGGGYIQCAPQTAPPAIYCEAQSAENWPVLARILTPARVAQLRAAGFADPRRAPNYWKIYPTSDYSDAAIAEELLTILHDIYRYEGVPTLEFKTEKGKG
jgi:T3SS (YopN, CesT) and YbjN peptide-binding chaperone 3